MNELHKSGLVKYLGKMHSMFSCSETMMDSVTLHFWQLYSFVNDLISAGMFSMSATKTWYPLLIILSLPAVSENIGH